MPVDEAEVRAAVLMAELTLAAEGGCQPQAAGARARLSHQRDVVADARCPRRGYDHGKTCLKVPSCTRAARTRVVNVWAKVGAVTKHVVECGGVVRQVANRRNERSGCASGRSI